MHRFRLYSNYILTAGCYSFLNHCLLFVMIKWFSMCRTSAHHSSTLSLSSPNVNTIDDYVLRLESLIYGLVLKVSREVTMRNRSAIRTFRVFPVSVRTRRRF